MTDEQLMRQIQAGDREALAELFRRHQKPLYNFFVRGLARPEDAEDLAMETLLRVFRFADQFQGRGSFPAWLYRLALNVARDRARRNQRRPEVLASTVEESWEAVEDDRTERRPEEAAFRSATAAAVRAAIEALPERERTALVLREYQQLSYVEVASALGVSMPAVKMLILRARGRVKKRLEARRGWEMAEVCP